MIRKATTSRAARISPKNVTIAAIERRSAALAVRLSKLAHDYAAHLADARRVQPGPIVGHEARGHVIEVAAVTHAVGILAEAVESWGGHKPEARRNLDAGMGYTPRLSPDGTAHLMVWFHSSTRAEKNAAYAEIGAANAARKAAEAAS